MEVLKSISIDQSEALELFRSGVVRDVKFIDVTFYAISDFMFINCEFSQGCIFIDSKATSFKDCQVDTLVIDGAEDLSLTDCKIKDIVTNTVNRKSIVTFNIINCDIQEIELSTNVISDLYLKDSDCYKFIIAHAEVEDLSIEKTELEKLTLLDCDVTNIDLFKLSKCEISSLDSTISSGAFSGFDAILSAIDSDIKDISFKDLTLNLKLERVDFQNNSLEKVTIPSVKADAMFTYNYVDSVYVNKKDVRKNPSSRNDDFYKIISE